MSKQVLSIEQMNHLQELGLDTSDAKMCWIKDAEENCTLEIHDEYCYEMSFMSPIPTYTLQDIFDKFPKYINPIPSEQILFAWMAERDTIAYRNVEMYDDIFTHFTDETLIDAAYDMLCWLFKNNYLPLKANSI